MYLKLSNHPVGTVVSHRDGAEWKIIKIQDGSDIQIKLIKNDGYYSVHVGYEMFINPDQFFPIVTSLSGSGAGWQIKARKKLKLRDLL